MNIQRLQALATFLRTVPQRHFDLQSWRSSADGDEEVTDADLASLHCGTTACAVGWACSLPEFQAQGLTWGTDENYTGGYPIFTLPDMPDYHSGWNAVEEFFDISYPTAEYLFSADEYPEVYPGMATSATAVADRIEKVIAPGSME